MTCLVKTVLVIIALISVARTAQSTEAPLPEEVLRLRDPFKRPALVVLSTEIKTPLQSYPISSLKLIGVLTGPMRLRGMILTPDGKTHFISEKAPIGQRNGVVLRIQEDRLIVRERIANILGQTENVDTELALSSAKPDSSAEGSAKANADANSAVENPGEQD